MVCGCFGNVKRLMHYYKKNLGDYAKKAGRLTILQHGIYNLLIDACYDREQFPTREEAIDWTWAATQEEIDGVDLILRKFFDLQSDGRYVQNRIKEELEAYQEKARKNKQTAIDRETKRKKESTKREEDDTKRTQDVNDWSPNHKPLTINHKDNTILGNDVPSVPHQKIIELYKTNLPMLIQVREWTESRSSLLRSRWREKPERQNLDWWDKFFKYISESDFLTGKNDKWKQCDLEWILKSKNFVKILEGKYHGESQ